MGSLGNHQPAPITRPVQGKMYHEGGAAARYLEYGDVDPSMDRVLAGGFRVQISFTAKGRRRPTHRNVKFFYAKLKGQGQFSAHSPILIASPDNAYLL